MQIQEQKVDIEHRQGKTFRRQIFVQELDSKKAINLTNCTARMQLREEASSDDSIIELTTENGRIGIVPEFGQLSLYISASDTAVIPDNSYVYDLEIEDSIGDVSSPMYGKFKITPEVTR